MTGMWVIRVLCLEKTGSELFYQFRSQDLLKMVNDRTGSVSSVRDVCSRLLCQSIAIDDWFLCALTVTGLAQSVQRLTTEREVAGSISGAGPLLRVLK